MDTEDEDEVVPRRRATDPLIIRIDERTKAIADEIKVLRASVVTRNEFQPVRLLVYGLVALMLTAVITGLMAQIIVSK